MIDNAKFVMVSSKYALVSISNVLMNVTVLEPKFVAETPIFFHVLKFIMTTLPSLENQGKNQLCQLLKTDGRTYERTRCAKTMTPTGRNCGLAEWINKYSQLISIVYFQQERHWSFMETCAFLDYWYWRTICIDQSRPISHHLNSSRL